ncbi:MAG: hypothetical protein ACRENG_33770, partial [bacterium]
VQDLAGGHPLEIFKDMRFSHLRWSPDGAELAVVVASDSVNGIFLMPRFGGAFRRIEYGTWPRWSPDGSHIAASFRNIKQIRITNKITGEGAPIALHGTFTWLRDLDWSPLGTLLLFLTADQKRYTIWPIGIDGSRQQKIFEDTLALSSPRWSANGRAIYYLRHKEQTKELMKIPIAPSTGKLRGSAEVFLSGLQWETYFTVSGDGKRLLYTRLLDYSNLWLAPIENAGSQMVKPKQITTGTSTINSADVSPDGKRLAISIGVRPIANIFTMPIEGGPMQQITFFNSFNTNPVWSPNGQEIAFGSDQDGTPKVWKVNVKGGTPRPFVRSNLSGSTFSIAWTPGSKILYHRPGDQNFHLLDPDTGEETALVWNESVGWIFDPCYSPDGKSLVVS